MKRESKQCSNVFHKLFLFLIYFVAIPLLWWSLLCNIFPARGSINRTNYYETWLTNGIHMVQMVDKVPLSKVHCYLQNNKKDFHVTLLTTS